MLPLIERIRQVEAGFTERRFAGLKRRIQEIVGRGQADASEAHQWLGILTEHRRELLYGGEHVDSVLRRVAAAETRPERTEEVLAELARKEARDRARLAELEKAINEEEIRRPLGGDDDSDGD